jgi:thiosulfate/3-mercaptopyruvate sulfurtransferase
MDMLVTSAWLASHGDAKIIDATYYALEPERDARADFERAHIPGALFLDLEHLADASSPWPSMAPPAEQFEARLRALGISEGDLVILYDQAPHKTAARAWWLFRLFGFERVALLDGGFARWKAEGLPVEAGAVAEPGGGDAAVRFDPALSRNVAQVTAMLDAGQAGQIVDARSEARFTGAEPDPRPGVASGHMPGAANLRYGRLFEADGTWKAPGAIAEEFRREGVDLERPVVTTCGSGITASILLFGLALTGKSDWALYDGSWSEWGALSETPKESVA